MSNESKTKGKLDTEEKRVRCSACGDEINPDSNACLKCGHETKQ